MFSADALLFIFSIILSIVLGIVAGTQRLHAGKKAGPRTYALVTVAATLFTLMSQQMGGEDRVAAAVLTGIGFIGAGMIMHKHKDSDIEGLTTAAGLWLMTGVGMAVGLFWWWQAVFVTAIALVLLMWNDHGR